MTVSFVVIDAVNNRFVSVRPLSQKSSRLPTPRLGPGPACAKLMALPTEATFPTIHSWRLLRVRRRNATDCDENEFPRESNGGVVRRSRDHCVGRPLMRHDCWKRLLTAHAPGARVDRSRAGAGQRRSMRKITCPENWATRNKEETCFASTTHLPRSRTGFDSRPGCPPDFRIPLPIPSTAYAHAFIPALLYTHLISPASVLKTSMYQPFRRGSGGLVVRLLPSHICEPGSITGGVVPGFSHVGIVSDDAAGRWVLLGDLTSPSSALKTPMLTGAQISPFYSPPAFHGYKRAMSDTRLRLGALGLDWILKTDDVMYAPDHKCDDGYRLSTVKIAWYGRSWEGEARFGYGAAAECEVRWEREIPEKTLRPAQRFPHAKVRERIRRESNPVRLGGRRVINAVWEGGPRPEPGRGGGCRRRRHCASRDVGSPGVKGGGGINTDWFPYSPPTRQDEHSGARGVPVLATCSCLKMGRGSAAGCHAEDTGNIRALTELADYCKRKRRSSRRVRTAEISHVSQTNSLETNCQQFPCGA
ncbi:hypothetical protein PR048_021174 [Dryococelus australis]|uniref:Uncharacterized protein n=1 Tax=Dryococelus australis TaxID=614101 RepID=A0ABQ9GXI7_9NEOP|nr:hypothetical protein PR048_021174 [Dryococelus australis]